MSGGDRPTRRHDRPRAIVLDVSHPRAVAVAHSLARRGIELWAVDHRPDSTGFYSKHFSRRFLLEGPNAGLAELLEEVAADGRGGFLMPTSDDTNVFVAQNHERLSRDYVLHTVPWSVLELTMDRAASYGVAAELGIRTPESHAPKDAGELERLLPRLDFGRADYVLKTRVWDAVANTRTRRHTLVPEQDAAGLRQAWLEITRRSRLPATVERVVPGESDDCLGVSLVIDRSFEPHVAYCIKRLRLYRYARGGSYRHPYEMGANVYCESTHDAEALEAALALVRRVGYYGAITVEFRRDPESGALYLIKLDPRVVRATGLSRALGQDVPLALYRSFVLGERSEPADYPDGVRWMWVNQYLQAVKQHATRRSALTEAARLLAILPRVRAFAYASPRDPLPFLKTLAPHSPIAERRLRRRLRGRAGLPAGLERVPAG